MGKRILAILLKIILIFISLFAMFFYIYFCEESKDLFLAIYFIFVFFIIYVLVIKMVIINSERSNNIKIYREIFFKIDTSNTLKNKKIIMDNIDFLKKMQFIYFYFLISPSSKQDIPKNFKDDKNLLKKFMKDDDFNNLMNKFNNLSVKKRYKELKKEKKDLRKKEFYQIVYNYDYKLYEEKMVQILNEKNYLMENNYGSIVEVLILVVTYCFPLIMYAKNREEKAILILSIFVLGVLLLILILIFKSLYVKNLKDENNDFIKKLEYFKQYKN